MHKIDEAVNEELAAVSDWGFSESSEKATPCLWIDFIFKSLLSDKGEKVFVRAFLYLTDATIPYVLKKLGNLGWHGKSIFELDKSSPDHYDLTNAEALLTVEMEPYNNKVRPVVKFINDPNFIPNKPMPRESLKLLDAKLKGKIAAYRTQNPRSTAGSDVE